MGKWSGVDQQKSDSAARPAISSEMELLYLRGYFIFAFVVYARWATLVINAICGYLGIRCLRITPKMQREPLLNGAVKKQ